MTAAAVKHRLWICAGEAGCDRILASPSIANAVAAGVLVIADPRQVAAAGGKLPSWLTGIPTLHDLEQSVAFAGRDCHLELDAHYMYADGLDEAAAAEQQQLRARRARAANQEQKEHEKEKAPPPPPPSRPSHPPPTARRPTTTPPPPSSSPLARELLVPSPSSEDNEEEDIDSDEEEDIDDYEEEEEEGDDEEEEEEEEQRQGQQQRQRQDLVLVDVATGRQLTRVMSPAASSSSPSSASFVRGGTGETVILMATPFL